MKGNHLKNNQRNPANPGNPWLKTIIMRITERTLRSLTKKTKEKFLSKSTVLLMIIFSTVAAKAQDAIEISGVVIDQERHEPLEGVAVSIKGTVAGTITSSAG